MRGGGSEAVVRFPRVANNEALFIFYVVGALTLKIRQVFQFNSRFVLVLRLFVCYFYSNPLPHLVYYRARLW